MATLPKRTGTRRPKPRASTFTTNDFVRRDDEATPAELEPTLEALRRRREARDQDGLGTSPDSRQR